MKRSTFFLCVAGILQKFLCKICDPIVSIPLSAVHKNPDNRSKYFSWPAFSYEFAG